MTPSRHFVPVSEDCPGTRNKNPKKVRRADSLFPRMPTSTPFGLAEDWVILNPFACQCSCPGCPGSASLKFPSLTAVCARLVAAAQNIHSINMQVSFMRGSLHPLFCARKRIHKPALSKPSPRHAKVAPALWRESKRRCRSPLPRNSCLHFLCRSGWPTGMARTWKRVWKCRVALRTLLSRRKCASPGIWESAKFRTRRW